MVGTVPETGKETGRFRRRSIGRSGLESFRRMGMIFGKGYPRLVGQNFESLFKTDPLDLFDKREDVSPQIADPTPIRLAFRIDLQARTVVIVPRTATDVDAPLPLKGRNITGNQVDDVDRLPDLFFDFKR